MVSIIQMKLEDSYRIRDIDRSETIDLIYKCKDGDLDEIKAGHECPNWNEDDYQEIIPRYEYELKNGGTAFGAYDGDKLVGFGVKSATATKFERISDLKEQKTIEVLRPCFTWYNLTNICRGWYLVLRKLCLIMIVLLVILTGCKSTNHFQPEDVDKITIDLIEKSEQPSGMACSFKLRNNSNYLIVQNDLYLSFPITSNHGLQRQGNKSKVEATGNKINIKPGEELMLNFFIPKEDYEGNQNLDSTHPELEFKGYLGTLTETNHFGKSGGLDYFSLNGFHQQNAHFSPGVN